MRIVILELLSSLNRQQPVDKPSKAIYLILVVSIQSVAQIIGWILYLETHVPAHSSAFWSKFHMLVHLKDSVALRFDSYIHQYAKLRVKQFAETLKKKHVGVEKFYFI